MSSRWWGTSEVEDGRSERRRRHLRIDSSTGIALLVVTKGFDAGTTAFGLTFVPWIEEGNPFVAVVFGVLGAIPGVLFLSAIGVLALILCTELIASSVDDEGRGYPALIRLIGYVPTSALFFVLGVQNAVLIVTGVSLFPP